MKKSIIAAIILAAGVGAAQAQTIVKATDVRTIAEIARGFGTAEISTDGAGDPKIDGRMDGTAYGIYFYGCKSGANCETIQLFTAWDHDGVSMRQINEWNRDKLFGTAFLDNENDPAIKLMVNLTHGTTKKNLEDTFLYWKTVVQSFKKSVLGR